MSCPICTDKYNSIRREIICENSECKESCCSRCIYIHTTESNTECICMYCNVEYSSDNLSKNLSKAGFDRIKTHKASMLMSRQKSLLPVTQNLANEHKKLKNMEIELTKMKVLAKEMKKAHTEQVVAIRTFEDEIRAIKTGEIGINVNVNNDDVNDDENKTIGEKCSVENCKGFLNRARKCIMCETYSCTNCHESKLSRNDPTHICNPDTVQTISLLNSDTKNCPNCSVPIFKIIGCSQMYCTSCFTAFDWNTMKIVKGRIHNPHFYELNNNGNFPMIRNAGDLECGGLPQWHIFNRFIPRDSIIRSAYRLILHINDVETRRFPLDENTEKFRNLRIDYLNDIINEKEWVSKLKQEQKKFEKGKEIRVLFDTFVQGSTGIIQILFNDMNDLREDNYIDREKLLISSSKEIINLKDYINSHFAIIRGKYTTITPHLNPKLSEVYYIKYEK